MKKEETFIFAQNISKLVIRYIEKILLNTGQVEGNMKFGSHKMHNINMCTLSIFVEKINLEKHINLGMPPEYCDVLYEQLFEDFFKTFMEHETIGISKFYISENFSGIEAINSMGGTLKIEFLQRGQKFNEIIGRYNKTISEYINGNKEIEKSK